ncbi:MAG: hypothetical protein KAR84_03480 [Elusimicrobiales bacterium]|nr:hypothetical protein [Elusimicrobiales bacterium]
MKKKTDIVLYKNKDGSVKLDVQLEKETIWLDAHKIGQLFDRDRSVVLKHIHNIYKTRELQKTATCAKIAQVASDFYAGRN